MNEIQEKSIEKALEIINFLKPLEQFGKIVCAGGAVRDALFNLPNPPKDYDIFIIDSKKYRDEECVLKRKSIKKFIKNYLSDNPKFSLEEEGWVDEYGDFPVANLQAKQSSEKIQIMFRHNTICELDLVDSFDWNICSCFITTEKEKYSIGRGSFFPIEIDSRGRRAFFNKASDLKRLSLFSDPRSKLVISKDFEEVQVVENSLIHIALNKDANISRPMVSLRRAFSFSNKFSKKYEVRIQKKSLELLSKKIYDSSMSSNYKVSENHYLAI